jgi:predicted kinase
MAGAKSVDFQSTRVIVLVGLPGSGKSHLAKRLGECGWTVCCRDDLGDRTACEQLAWESLEQGGHVVIDRTNVCARQRGQWVQLCRAASPDARIAVVVLRADVDECVRRVTTRCNHPTLQGEHAGVVIQRFVAEFEEPNVSEGFDKVWDCECEDDFEMLLSSVATSTIGYAIPRKRSPCSGHPDTKTEYLGSVFWKMACVYVTELFCGRLVCDQSRAWWCQFGRGPCSTRSSSNV